MPFGVSRGDPAAPTCLLTLETLPPNYALFLKTSFTQISPLRPPVLPLRHRVETNANKCRPLPRCLNALVEFVALSGSFPTRSAAG
jgi:hypothetical protein